MTTPNPTTPTPADDGPDVCCPACGYSLRGVCSRESPMGRCPECGGAFTLDQILARQRERAAFPMSLLVMQLLLFPIVIIFCGIFCVAGAWDAFFFDEPSTAVFGLLMVGVPLFGAFLAGGIIARQYYPRSVSGIAPEHRRGMQRHIILPWLLFFVIEAVLTAVYFVGGCAAILVGLGFL